MSAIAEEDSQPWRLFIAIELPTEIRQDLEVLSSRLQKAFQFTSCSPTWAKPEAFHLTLRFLGPVPPSDIPCLAAGLEEVVRKTRSPRIRAMGLGVFPDWKRPRVLWAGMRDKNNLLVPLQRSLEELVCDLGFEGDDKPWRPHLTLARFKRLKGTHVVRDIVSAHDGFKTALFVPSGVSLMRSVLHPEGARHTRLNLASFADGE